MAERWLYWVTFVVQKEGQVAIHGQFAASSIALNSEEAVTALIESLTLENVADPEPGTMPVVPICWQLVSAKKGAAVEAPKRKPDGGGHA